MVLIFSVQWRQRWIISSIFFYFSYAAQVKFTKTCPLKKHTSKLLHRVDTPHKQRLDDVLFLGTICCRVIWVYFFFFSTRNNNFFYYQTQHITHLYLRTDENEEKRNSFTIATKQDTYSACTQSSRGKYIVLLLRVYICVVCRQPNCVHKIYEKKITPTVAFVSYKESFTIRADYA